MSIGDDDKKFVRFITTEVENTAVENFILQQQKL